VSVSPDNDESYQSGQTHCQTRVRSRRPVPTSDIDSESFVESPCASDGDEQRSLSSHWLSCLISVLSFTLSLDAFCMLPNLTVNKSFGQ